MDLDNLDYYQYYYLSANPHPVAVQYLLNHLNKIHWSQFSANPNDDAVSYLLEHLDKLDIWTAYTNTNPRMIWYLLNEVCPPNHNIHGLALNPADEAVTYLLQNTHHISWEYFPRNTNDMAVQHTISKLPSLREEVFRTFCKNPNKIAVDYILEHADITSYFEYLLYNSNDLIYDIVCLHPKFNPRNYNPMFPNNLHLAHNSNDKNVIWMLKNVGGGLGVDQHLLTKINLLDADIADYINKLPKLPNAIYQNELLFEMNTYILK